MGPSGMKVIKKVLKDIQKKYKVELTIAQAENVTEGKGLSRRDYESLQTLGVDFMTGGNWTLHLKETHSLLDKPDAVVIRPANYLEGTPGMKYKYLETEKGKILMVSLLGNIVGKSAHEPMNNPLRVIDEILVEEKDEPKIATIVNFHGDFSSQKVVIGHYLDGRVSAVIGDHWHVPTNDARVLPKSTAHISDVGMCGSLNSSLGVKLPIIIERWRDSKPSKNVLEEDDSEYQFNAVLIDVDIKTGLAKSIKSINEYFTI